MMYLKACVTFYDRLRTVKQIENMPCTFFHLSFIEACAFNLRSLSVCREVFFDQCVQVVQSICAGHGRKARRQLFS